MNLLYSPLDPFLCSSFFSTIIEHGSPYVHIHAIYTTSTPTAMNNSISDILASVTRAAYTTTPFLGLSPSTTTLSTAQVDLQQLTRAWVSERAAPELLPYPTDLMDRVMARIREQVISLPFYLGSITAGRRADLMRTVVDRLD